MGKRNRSPRQAYGLPIAPSLGNIGGSRRLEIVAPNVPSVNDPFGGQPEGSASKDRRDRRGKRWNSISSGFSQLAEDF